MIILLDHQTLVASGLTEQRRGSSRRSERRAQQRLGTYSSLQMKLEETADFVWRDPDLSDLLMKEFQEMFELALELNCGEDLWYRSKKMGLKESSLVMHRAEEI